MRKLALLLIMLLAACLQPALAEKTVGDFEAATALFNDVYLPFVQREMGHTFDGASIAAQNCGFPYEIKQDGMSGITIYADESRDGDTVWLGFLPNEDDIEMAYCVSYYAKAQNAEVSWNNLSTDGSAEYDFLNTHVLGELENKVDSVEDQAAFLFGK